MKRTAIAVALLLLGTPLAQAETFGGLDIARTHDTNFTGAPDADPKVAEDITVYSGYLGYYWPSADQRSAYIVKADVSATRLDRFDTLDNYGFGLSVGRYQALGRNHSMTATLGASTQRFDDDLRNLDVYSAQIGFKQKISQRFWLREGLIVEKSAADSRANEYNGYGVGGSLNWSPVRSTLLTLGASHNVRLYDVAEADRRTSNQLTLGVVQEFGDHFYLRASASQQDSKTNAGTRYDTTLYTVGVGINM